MVHQRSTTLVTTERLKDQRGASLVLALALILVLAVVLSAVLAYTGTVYKTSNTYQTQRMERYAGDGAIEAGINYVRGQDGLGIDPDYAAIDPCVYNVLTDIGTVAVTCTADPGSGSGVPTETGQVPDQAILALGQRHNEVGPLNQTQCQTVWGIGQSAKAEDSIYFNQGEVRGYFEEGSLIPCDERNRTIGTFSVRGDVLAAGNISGEGTVAMQPKTVGNSTVASAIKAGRACTIAATPACQSNQPASTFTDPGGAGTVDAWKTVPIDWSKNRTSGYILDATNPTGKVSDLVPVSTCTANKTLILLPGVYKNANTINQFTASAACTGATIWLAPDPGADQILLTDDDKTGAFYFGFENGNTSFSCSDLSNLPHRLCVGGASAASNPRVVSGTPDGWNPLALPGSTTPITVTMDSAQTVDSGLSQTWYNGNNAKRIDGAVADYKATFCVFVCISTNRSIRVRDFAPQVGYGPNNLAISIEVGHRESASSVGTPQVEVRTVSPESGTRTCTGNFTVPLNTSANVVVHKLQLGGSEAAAAEAVAKCMRPDPNNNGQLPSYDRINGIQVTMKWTGNTFNSGDPRVYLDGARISFVADPGASFPIATSPTNPAATRSCDPTKAGTQLIFGGDSHAYIPDGSMEICAGPYPTNPGDHQQIAVYGVPAVNPIRPSTVTASGSSLNNANGAKQIAEPNGTSLTRISYSTGDTCGFCTIDFEGRAVMAMPGYTPPAGLQVQRVDARAAYNSKNSCLLGWCPFGTAAQLRVGSCNIDAAATSDLRHMEENVMGGGRSCINASQLASGINVTWAARAKRICAFWICGSGSYTDDLDGVELLVSLSQTSGSTTPVPQSGCIVDYPNYWEGVGSGDCAIIKSDSLRPNSIFSNEADWVGRLSIQGTVYAPSAAFEIDEIDSAYSLASRGLVVRHLRIKGFRARPGYTDPIIDTELDTTPKPKDVTFYACKRGVGRENSTELCTPDDGDRILTKARVHFEYDATNPDSWTPEVVWWTDER